MTYACIAHGWSPAFVTCIFRTPLEDKALGGTGIHSSWRAVDIRTAAGGISDATVDDVVQWANSHYCYNPKVPRIPVAYAKPHGSGPHLHIQVHPSTVERVQKVGDSA